MVAMLACARIGAVHRVVFGGFAAKELATRIEDAKPKVILSASCGLEPGRIVHYKPLLDEAIELAARQAAGLHRSCSGRSSRCELIARPRPRLGRACAMRALARPQGGGLRAGARRPIRSTSSTPRARPGRPKGVVRDNGGHMVALKWSMKNLYGIEPGEVWWAAPTSAGWSATPTSSMRRCSTARPRSSTRASRSARRTPARSGA